MEARRQRPPGIVDPRVVWATARVPGYAAESAYADTPRRAPERIDMCAAGAARGKTTRWDASPAGMLGYDTNRAEALATWKRYAAGDRSRSRAPS